MGAIGCFEVGLECAAMQGNTGKGWLDLKDSAGALLIAVPCIAAMVTVSASISDMLIFEGNAGRIEIGVLLANLAFTLVGSGSLGLRAPGSAAIRIGAAMFTAAIGLLIYTVAIVWLGIVGTAAVFVARTFAGYR
jgi:hypothetical protein